MNWSIDNQTFPCDPKLSERLRVRIRGDFTDRWNRLWRGRFVTHGRIPTSNAVRLDGNDYLGLTGHPEIVQAQINAMKRDCEFSIQSGVFLQETHPVHELERDISLWIGKEDGLICQSGYAANIGLLQTIADEETPVYIDTLAHTSLWEGARAAKAPIYPFRHNDPANLHRVVAKHGPGLVVVDSVYSTTGALCPLHDIVEVAESNECMTLVDESHSLGTHGPTGAGLCAELGLSHRVNFITASLAKAFAGRAGYFSIPAAMRYYLLASSFPAIFSSCLLPHEIAGLAATLRVVQRSECKRDRLHSLSRRLRDEFISLGYPVQQGSEQIISLEAGSEPATMELRDLMEERNVFGAVFCAPATSRNRAMLRMTVSSALTDADIDQVVSAAEEVAPIVKPWEWPIARRPTLTQKNDRLMTPV